MDDPYNPNVGRRFPWRYNRYNKVLDADDEQVAVVLRFDGPNDVENAAIRSFGHLIAAAPDLRTACEKALRCLTQDPDPSDPYTHPILVVEAINAALAKSRGES